MGWVCRLTIQLVCLASLKKDNKTDLHEIPPPNPPYPPIYEGHLTEFWCESFCQLILK